MSGAPGSLRMTAIAAATTALSMVCLGGTFLSGRWFVPALFAIAFTVAGCEVARRLSAGPLVTPLAGLTALLVYLVARYASEQALVGVVPTPDAMEHLGELVRRGNDAIARYAAPITVVPEVELFAVAGVGLVALAVDTLAVTLRRAALAGLPLLALYTVPVSVAPGGVRWEAFVLGGAGYLALLLADNRERLSRWGRPLGFSARADWRPDADPERLAQVGHRVGAAALGLALVVPLVVPTLDASSFGLGGFGFGNGGGGSTVAVVNPIIDLGEDLRQDTNRPVLRYDGPPTYIRMVGLDAFDGRSWRPSRLEVRNQDVQDGLPEPPGLRGGAERGESNYRIEVFDLEQRWLPLPYPAKRVDIDGHWVYDVSTFNVFSTTTSTRRMTYDVVTRDVHPTPENLRAAGSPPESLRRYLELPLGIPTVVRRTAQDVTQGRPTAYDQALALQNWLRNPQEFTYSPDAPDGNGGRAIANFLAIRRGYCVHFASTMAVMARQLGIPARVAVGFTAGTTDEEHRRVVALHDAHAWPELYFDGVGWVAFEPTPGVRTGPPPQYAQPPDTGNGSAGGPGAVPSGGPRSTTDPRSRLGGRLPPLGTETPVPDSGGSAVNPLRLPVVPLLILVGLMLSSLVPLVTRVAVRRRRWRRATTPAAEAAAAWAELHDLLVDYGYDWRPSDSPRRGAARVTEELGLTRDSAQAVRRLGSAIERARYAVELGEIDDLRGDVWLVGEALWRRSSWGVRLRAVMLPRSTRAVATAASERIADGLDAADAAVAGVGARLRPHRRTT